MQVKVPGSAKKSPDGVIKRISAPFRLKVGSIRIPVIPSISSRKKSIISLKAWGSMPEMIPFTETVGHRPGNPVDIQAKQIQQFPADNGYFGSINAVGTKNRTSPALRALEEITPPFFQRHLRSRSRAPTIFLKILPAMVNSRR